MPINSMHKWQGFREELMYNIECNDVLEANQEEIKQVYNQFISFHQKVMSFDNVCDLFMRMTPLNMSLKDVTYCFGMSKQTIVNEQDDREYAKYS